MKPLPSWTLGEQPKKSFVKDKSWTNLQAAESHRLTFIQCKYGGHWLTFAFMWSFLAISTCLSEARGEEQHLTKLNSSDHQSIGLSDFFKREKSNKSVILATKCGYFLVSLLLYDRKLNIFGLWAKHDLWGHHHGLWGTLMDIFSPFSDNN